MGFGLDTKDTAMSLFSLNVFKTGRENRSERLKFGKAVPMSLSFSSPLFSLLPYPHFEGSLGCPGFGKEMNYVSLCWLCKDG